jgi:hypothetical protein
MRRSNEDARAEAVIGVGMDDDCIVIRPVGHLDRAALDALRSLLEGARATGAIAVVDVARLDHGDLAIVEAITADHMITAASAS